MKSRIPIAIVLVLIIILGWFTLKNQSAITPTVKPEITSTVAPSNTPTPDPVVSNQPYEMFIKGTTFTKDPYHIFIPQEGEGNTYSEFTYTKQGVIQSEPYVGYTEVIATRTYDGPSLTGPGVFAFITKDFKTFLVAKQYTLENESYERFNKDTVLGLVDFTISHPDKLTYQGLTFARREIYQKGEYVYGYKGARLFVSGDLSAYAEYIAHSEERIKPFIQGTSRLLVQDQYGVIFAYTPVLQDDQGVIFKNSDFVNFKTGYTMYGDAIPSACGMPTGNKILTNIQDKDVEKVTTTVKGVEIFSLRNKNHPLYKAQYQRKIDDQKDYFISVNPEYKKIPTYEEYVLKNPLLLYKDMWRRWNVVGEFEYKLDGGCGKPVIYLYPEKTTDVSISFVPSVKLSTDIPTYSNGWKVKAHPDGTLLDMQKEKTDCTAIDASKVGSEYAKSACEKGVYPCIYWAGDVDAHYPIVQEGFVIAEKDLKSTLEEKLSVIGLSEKETADMVQYWYPYLLKKDFPYYRLTFFQNKEMNAFIPMNVSPRPDTVVRVFLDWEGLDTKVTIRPQVLNHIDRKGFTLVEWGGVKK